MSFNQTACIVNREQHLCICAHWQGSGDYYIETESVPVPIGPVPVPGPGCVSSPGQVKVW